MKKGKNGFYCRHIKRFLDIVCALLALTVFGWLYLLLALLVKIKLGSPVIHKAKRVGKDNRVFTFYKFRSMSNECDANGILLPDAQRITKFGSLLRASSLDELPEALNILKGDMSVIGPRPLPELYMPYYTEKEIERHSVRGGLSGLAQVNGRNALSWEEKFKYDLQYVENISFLLDVKILFQTIKKVFKHSDIGLRGVTGPEDFNIYRSKQTEVVK